MPLNGSGTYTPPAADFPAVAGTVIESAKFNNVINDIASAISTAIMKDGQSSPSAAIPFNAKKITGLAPGTAGTDAANLDNIQAAKDQWKLSQLVPTYVSTTSFTVPGDQTADFTFARRIKATVSGGTRYGFILGSAFTTLTTVTVLLDSSTLNVGLSEIYLGIVTPSSTAIPQNFKPRFNTLDFGITFDSTTDDTVAWQLAIDTVTAARGILEVVPTSPGNYSKITAPLEFSGPIEIRGPGPNAATIMGVNMAAGQYMFDFDLLAASNVEWVILSGFTLRSDDNDPNGIRFKNVSYVHMRDVLFYNLEHGAVIDGTRCFTHIYDNCVGYTITGSTFRMASTFAGGGQFIFNGSTFTGDVGFEALAGSFADNVSFNGCNFEQCVSHSVGYFGTTAGLNFNGSRTEGCNGVDFNIRPFGAAEYVAGLNISGCVFGASDAGAVGRIYLGGDSGEVRGFSITGNVVTHGSDSFSGDFVTTNGDGESGIVCGNMLRGTTCRIISAQRDGVVVFANENLAGKLPEYWGNSSWGVTEGTSAFTDGSGAGLAFALSALQYTKIGRTLHYQAVVLYPATASGSQAALNGLPYAVLAGSGSQGRSGCSIGSDAGLDIFGLHGYSTTTSISIFNRQTLAAVANSQLSGKTLYIYGQYAI